MLNSWGFYHIPCEYSVGYIDRTERARKLRVKGHVMCVSKRESSSSLAVNHFWKIGHDFKIPNVKILYFPLSTSELHSLEDTSTFFQST